MSPWLRVWTRAVIAPASRRATAVWIGAGIGGGIVFGPTGMHPADLTQLAIHVPGVGAVLCLTWLLLFVPTARLLVRQDAASYLRSLPAARLPAVLLAALALVGLQLPWLALWLAGEGPRGLVMVVGLSLVIAPLAAVRLRPTRAGWPRWRNNRTALTGVYVRALRRRATDALVRGVGLAVLAGLVAGLVVRNNALVGDRGAAIGTGVIAVVLIPGWVGALLPLIEAHRASTWLAASLGISVPSRIAVLALSVSLVYLLGTAVAVIAAIALVGVTTAGWLALIAFPATLGIALAQTRAMLRAERNDRSTATRVVTGAITASAVAVISIAWLGMLGAPVMLLIGICALVSVRPA